MPILNKHSVKQYCLLTISILFCFFIFGQNNTYEKRWNDLHQTIEYQKSERPKGPKNTRIFPDEFNEEDISSLKRNDIRPTNEDIIYSREKRYSNGESKGIKKKISEEKSWSLDDLTTPDVESPEIKQQKWNSNFKYNNILKVILYALILGAVAYLIYFFFLKNKFKSNRDIAHNSNLINNREVNPTDFKKSQLELDLEKAINEENYRLAVRIYYILLLKILIEENLIKWEKRKTNIHYLLEMRGKKEWESFSRSINIYEWTWYGKNQIDLRVFNQFSSFYKELLNRLEHER